MTVLSDRGIIRAVRQSRIKITPFYESLVQPASIDLRLAGEFQHYKAGVTALIDLHEDQADALEYVAMTGNDDPYILHPNKFVLGRTIEFVELSDSITARLDGKSSLARAGLAIHFAGWIDPGFRGTITLEMSNVAEAPITLYPEMPIGQLSFMPLDMPASHPYQGKYVGQIEPGASKMHENFEIETPKQWRCMCPDSMSPGANPGEFCDSCLHRVEYR